MSASCAAGPSPGRLDLAYNRGLRPGRPSPGTGPRRSVATALIGLAATLLAGFVPATPAAERSSPATWPDGASPSGTTPVDATPVLRDVDAAAATAVGSIAVVVVDRGGQLLVAGPDAGEVTYTASLVKLLVVARLLALHRSGSLRSSALTSPSWSVPWSRPTTTP